jgi:hypothetical protein
MLLIFPKLFVERQDTPPLVQRILKREGRIFDKWEQLRLFQDPYLRSKKENENPFPLIYSTVVAHQTNYRVVKQRNRCILLTADAQNDGAF